MLAAAIRRHRALPIAGLIAGALVLPAAAAASSPEHGSLDGLLRDHVREGHVDYPAIAADERFARYLETLRATDAGALGEGDERLAFWINAYNALAIKGILDGGSPSTFFGRLGYFGGSKYEVGGRSINLYDLERKVIIPIGDSRIHFAINCASESCPLLRAEAYDPARLDAQLDDATRQFLNDPERNRFDADERVARLSMIFKWFGDEFSAKAGSVLEYVAPYVDDPQLAASLRQDDWRVEFLEYDWSLNGTPP